MFYVIEIGRKAVWRILPEPGNDRVATIEKPGNRRLNEMARQSFSPLMKPSIETTLRLENNRLFIRVEEDDMRTLQEGSWSWAQI